MDRYIAVGTLDYKTYEGDMGIHLLRMDHEGRLELLHSSYDGLNPTYVIRGRQDGQVYAVSERLHKVQAACYKMAADGKSLSLSSVLETAGAGGVHAELAPDGRHILVACWKSADVIACLLDDKGEIKEAESSLSLPDGHGPRARQMQPNPHQVIFDRSGAYFAVPDLGADRLHMVSWDAGRGSMRWIGMEQTDAGDGPRHGVFHPNNRWFYLYAELACSVYLYDFCEADGSILRRQKIDLIPADFWNGYSGPEIQGAEMVISPDLKFLFVSLRGYVTEQGFDRIIRLRLDPETGMLSEPVSFSCAGHCPRAFAFTPDGRYLLVCNQDDGEVTALHYNSKTGEIGGVCGKAGVREAASIAFIG